MDNIERPANIPNGTKLGRIPITLSATQIIATELDFRSLFESTYWLSLSLVNIHTVTTIIPINTAPAAYRPAVTEEYDILSESGSAPITSPISKGILGDGRTDVRSYGACLSANTTRAITADR